MADTPSTMHDEARRETVRARLQTRYGADRAASLFGYWQLLGAPDGTSRLRATLGPAGFRSALADLAAAGVDLPRQGSAGPVAGVEAQPGDGTGAHNTVNRQLVRQAQLQGLFGWGEVAGRVDLSYVRAGAPGYTRDTLVIGLVARGLMPATYHWLEVRARPSLLQASPPVLVRVGSHAEPTGHLRVFVSQAAADDSAEITTLFGGQGGDIEVVIYRSYDGPTADDTSFLVARGVLQ